jgi:hypothetical protein
LQRGLYIFDLSAALYLCIHLFLPLQGGKRGEAASLSLGCLE